MNGIVFGSLVGMALGFALAFGGFGDMLIVAVFTAIGFGVAKILVGDADIMGYLNWRRDRRR